MTDIHEDVDHNRERSNASGYEGAFGTLRLGESTPMGLDAVGLIASMTKAITSAAAMTRGAEQA
jgi:CubicO group peptidase (beta-lactamase class C family)